MRTTTVLLGTLSTAAVAMTLSITALAGSVTIVDYNLSHPTGDLGHSHVYGSTGYDLTISGFKTDIMPNFMAGTWNIASDHDRSDLYGKYKNGKPGESGLGMNADPNHREHEIFYQPGARDGFGLLVLDLSQIEANPNVLDFQLGISSSQAPDEMYTVWGSTAADPWSAVLLKSGIGDNQAVTGFFDVPNYSDYRYLWVGAEIRPGSHLNHSDVLLDAQISINNNPPPPIPEPSTFALLGSGLLTAGFSLRQYFGSGIQHKGGRRQSISS